MHKSKVTGIVIAGGKSSRMGTNKSLIEYRSKRFIDYAIQTLQQHTQNILISSNTKIPNVTYPIIADEYADIGPLGGLYSCLNVSNTALNLIIPCDVPHIEPNTYLKLAENSEGFDAIIPRLPNGKIEPLIACYKKLILPIIFGQINIGDYKMLHLLQKIKVNYIDFEDAEQFKNMNTPNDLI